MVALVFEVYGAFCFFALIAFIIWAAVAKLRPDLEEEEFEFIELEKLKQLVNAEPSDEPLSLEPQIIEEPFWSPPARPVKVKQSKRPIRTGPRLLPARRPRTI
jgi:hypothetical protein